MTRKLLVQDAKGEREMLMVGRMSVGRDPRCEISDPDPLLSRKHAEFTEVAEGVCVRDLHSRNGLQVNGVNVNEAILRSGDVVRIARLTIRYTDDRASMPGASLAGTEDDDPDNTVVVPPPFATPAAPRPAAATADEDDATRVVPAPPGAVSVPRRKIATRPHAAAALASQVPAAAPSRPAARARLAPWSTRVTVRLMALSVGVFLIAALPLWLWQQRVIDRVAVSRGSSIAQWLAASAAAAEAAGVIEESVQQVSDEASIVSALVVGLDGRVVSPPSRATETVTRIPGIDVEISDLVRPRSAWRGDYVEIAVPVMSPRKERVAVAWVTVHPASLPEASAGAFVVLVPALLCALGGGFLVARQVQRMTLSGLITLNQDTELALSGHLATVSDTLNARPVRDLTDTLNYLLARVRAGATPAEGRTPVTEVAIVPPAAPGLALEARLVADASFRVREATPSCLELLGVKPEALLGQHLLDAMADGAIAEAVLRCLAGLQESGDARAAIASRGLSLRIARAAADASVTVTFTRETAVVQA